MVNDETALLDGVTDGDDFAEECEATGSGILRCLQMLSEEASALSLPRTLDALRHAMAACAAEAHGQSELAAFASLCRVPGSLLH